MQNTIVEEIIKLAEQYPEISMLTADLGTNIGIRAFEQRFPQRYFNMGIAEQNLMSVAAGMALSGGIPFVATFACYASMRACEQVRTSIAYQNVKVRIIASHSGLSVGENGASHQCLEDISIMRAIPNMVILSPAGIDEVKEMITQTMYINGPIYIRLPRVHESFSVNSKKEIAIGKAIIVKEGRDITLVSTGYMLSRALNAAKILENEGVSVQVMHIGTIKPFDKPAIKMAAIATRIMITIEDHSIIGGLFSAVAEVIAENAINCIVKPIGVNDVFAESGNYLQLIEKYEIGAKSIAKKAIELIGGARIEN